MSYIKLFFVGHSSMRKILFSVLIILSVLFLGFFSTTFGEMMMTSTVGVASGDVFRYSYTCYFNSNDPHAVPPASFSWINQTDYFMVNVTGVSGSSVNFETMMRGLNGTNSIGVVQHERWDGYGVNFGIRWSHGR